MKKMLLSAVLFFILASPINAGQKYSQIAFKCVFTKYIINDWKSGSKMDIKIGERKLELYFSGINAKNRTAIVTGNAGSEKVFYFYTNKGISFIEITLTGNTNYTTILNKLDNGKYPAISSRHISFAGEDNFFASQNYGFCQKLHTRGT